MTGEARRGVAVAKSIDLPAGRRIWVPPQGRPYWVGGTNAGLDLTDAELEYYGLEAAGKENPNGQEPG